MSGLVQRIILWAGILLVLIGLVTRYVFGVRGGSTLIPAFFGMPIALLGFTALDPQHTRASLRWVMGLALLGLLMTLPIFPLISALLRGEQPSGNPVAILASSAMLLLCSALLVICFATFVHGWWKRRHGGQLKPSP
ncbi:MAG: hypothetical protein MUD01_28900 [Chloroflexaceae bacterium]|jgi:hypothetical protein|nr:hypothetical protein [Chloroflexaceae bacterium]